MRRAFARRNFARTRIADLRNGWRRNKREADSFLAISPRYFAIVSSLSLSLSLSLPRRGWLSESGYAKSQLLRGSCGMRRQWCVKNFATKDIVKSAETLETSNNATPSTPIRWILQHRSDDSQRKRSETKADPLESLHLVYSLTPAHYLRARFRSRSSTGSSTETRDTTFRNSNNF
jgi:hypothetical protein